jgi:ATP-dependent DNA ligase
MADTESASMGGSGGLSSRQEHPAVFVVFDLLAGADGKSRLKNPMHERRKELEQFARKFFPDHPRLRLSPAFSGS